MAEPPVVPLQSKDHKLLMDIIDKLRYKGISRYINLPQIVVCGDQSSGKSSVLQAISGMSFPTKDSLCTRFATELILRHTDSHAQENCSVSIRPGSERSPEDKRRLEAFQHSEIPDQTNIGALVDKAKEFMGVGDGKTFSTDTLRIELSGPAQPHLTIVDLPGLFRAANREQSASDAKVVRSLVRFYIKNPRSIILAVVSAKSESILQDVTEHTRDVDPHGLRTLGLITKPDTLDVGSDDERKYFDMAQNRDVVFRLGWHVVRNRDFKSRNTTDQERSQAEADFFAQGIWSALAPRYKGAAALQVRLSEVLNDHILDQMADVLSDIEGGISDCSSRLERLGAARGTPDEQRKYLLTASHHFSTLVREAVDGVYRDKFFSDARDENGYGKRLRAVVQNILTDFSRDMRQHGQARKIVETPNHNDPRQIPRHKYLEEVKALMRRTRGRELPGTYNPLIIGDLFHEQCRPWKELLEKFSGEILKSVDHSIDAILTHVLDDITKAELWAELISPGLDRLKEGLYGKISEILEPHEYGHPITYNHYFTENFQKAQTQRHREILRNRLTSLSTQAFANQITASIDRILDVLTGQTEADMESLACSTATDMMEAYYKVALKDVVHDFDTLAVEDCLISKLAGLFTPDVVFQLHDDVMSRIAGESEEIATERKMLEEKLEVLVNGQKELKHLSRRHQPIISKNLAVDDTPLGSDKSESSREHSLGSDKQSPSTILVADKQTTFGTASKDKPFEWKSPPPKSVLFPVKYIPQNPFL